MQSSFACVAIGGEGEGGFEGFGGFDVGAGRVGINSMPIVHAAVECTSSEESEDWSPDVFFRDYHGLKSAWFTTVAHKW